MAMLVRLFDPAFRQSTLPVESAYAFDPKAQWPNAPLRTNIGTKPRISKRDRKR